MTGPSSPEHPVGRLGLEAACAASCAGLPGMTAVRLAKILSGWDPIRAWQALGRGRHPSDDHRLFRDVVRDTDPRVVAEQYERAGVGVHLRTSPGYPAILRDDPGAPAVLFSRGTPSALDGRARVAIVGTRSATAYGLQVASELGRELAEAGVAVVSGLALGIDAAAHAGALRAGRDDPAPPVAVVGTGLDVVYPKGNASLWRQVEEHGVVFTESALGTIPQPRVFPARNRIIAALSDVVVVVECQLKGGALYTAEAAARRAIPVCAVPGSVRSPASAGTNGLLVDGCAPVRDVDDILTAVALARCGKEAPNPATQSSTLVAAKGRERPHKDSIGPDRPTPASRPARATRGSRPRRPPGPGPGPGPGPVQQSFEHAGLGDDPRAVLAALESSPTTMDTILLRTSLSLARAAAACDSLTRAGTVDAGPGWWALR
ncbi:MAG TPA: DNA-processing protein DprA [Acidimicrobiales bacterium]